MPRLPGLFRMRADPRWGGDARSSPRQDFLAGEKLPRPIDDYIALRRVSCGGPLATFSSPLSLLCRPTGTGSRSGAGAHGSTCSGGLARQEPRHKWHVLGRIP